MANQADLDSEIVATFPVSIDLPMPAHSPLDDASAAIKNEYRISVRKKRLRCLEWERVSDRKEGSIYALKVGRTVEFDWTWEGALAYRPGVLMDDSSDDVSVEDSGEEEMYWCGEVVEVDETSGRIFVSIANPDQEPSTGTFYVRPFEFLGLLNEVYNSQKFADVRSLLPPRLGATEGGIYPRLGDPISQGMPSLQPMWDHAWGILWGPPGTGKTYSIGQQVARCLDDPTERILVVSTTNKAVDGAAIQVGKACRPLGSLACSEGSILRVGKGVKLKTFDEEGLDDLIRGSEADLLRDAALLKELRAAEKMPENRASLLVEINAILKRVNDVSRHAFMATDIDVVVSTAFRASTMLWYPEYREMIEQGQAPFTTIIIDEAGLISRAATAVLSLLASRQVVLAGDPKQLAPISRMSRVLPTTQAHWLASSGLGHLQDVHQHDEGMHLLKTQYRMRPEISEVVSHYQYGGELQTADEVKHREFDVPKLLRDQPRAIWYVIDEDKGEFAQIRAERGPGNRSWVRRKTRDVLEKLFSDPQVQTSQGLFVSPFVAQAKSIAAMFAEKGYASWTASTVHSQQGAEADIVIFDTVNASSTSWSIHEWLRLVNVGLSRAREQVILIASRSEMQSPFLKPLLRSLRPAVLNRVGSVWRWAEVSANAEYTVPDVISANPDLLGSQITSRKTMRPVLSHDQQRLCGFEMDGKPRLVRGVAGSGKTVVLGQWLRKTLDRIEGTPSAKIWAVFANKALRHLLHETIETAWREDKGDLPFPWHRVDLWHVRDMLDLLLREVGKNMGQFQYEYDEAAQAYLDAMKGREIKPRCHALFADEGQDLGPNTLKLVTAIVEHGDPVHPNSRSVNIFYDNAQNIYNRRTPKWSEMGLDMRGRSTVMKESFRATRPITEFAFNVLHRLGPDQAKSSDHKELVEMGLVELCEREGSPWWNVWFTQIDGPSPIFKKCPNKEVEFATIGNQLIRWIKDEGVKPSDICILYMTDYPRSKLESQVKPMLASIGVDLQFLKGEAIPPNGRTVIATSPHSFKGYDSEIVVIPSIEMFQSGGKPLTQVLYVAMTRARSVLAIYGKATRKDGEREIIEAIESCLDGLEVRPLVEVAILESDEFEDILHSIGIECREWLNDLRGTHRLVQEPLLASDRTILCEPLFWYESESRRYACFPKGKPSQRIKNDLEDAGVTILVPIKKD